MKSFAAKSSLLRQVPYLAACILISTASACESDDSDEGSSKGTQESEPEHDGGSGEQHNHHDGSVDSEQAEKDQSDDDARDQPVGPEDSPEAQAARDEAANPGSATVTRYDGTWMGTTSQDKPISFKVLNRFLAHAEIGYELEGDGCNADAGEIKFSAMTPMRMNGFTLMNATDTSTVVISGTFTDDDASNGEYSVELTGEVPEGCAASVSGTWTASK